MDYIAFKERLLMYGVVAMRGYRITLTAEGITVYANDTVIYRTPFISYAYQFVNSCEEI